MFESRPATLNTESICGKVYYEPTDSYEDLLAEYNFSSTLNYLAFDLGVTITPLETIPIMFRTGFEISTPAVTNEFNNERTVIEPVGALLNGSPVETIEEGEFESVNLAQALTATIGYKLDLGEIDLTPELTYRYQLNNSFSDRNWKTNVIRIGVNFAWDLTDDEIDITEPIKKKDDPKPEIIVEDKKDEKTPSGIEDEILINQSLNITETVVTQTYPILPYIFFDSASHKLMSKYQIYRTEDFSEKDLPKNSIEIYQNLLNIIGNRMKEDNSYTLTITGYTDGEELTNPYSSTLLARKRAESVKNYLIQTWGINTNRIKTLEGGKPELSTSTAYREGYEENRRVELSTNNNELFKPVIHSRFLEYTSEDKNLIYEFNTEKDFKDFTVIVKNNDNQFYSKTYLNVNNIESIKLDKELISNIGSSYNDTYIEVIGTTNEGKVVNKSKKINVNLNKSNFELGRLNLIVFDFDKSEISNLNREMIDKFVLNSVYNESTVNITGSTDNLGERQYNQSLSKKRAETVRSYIDSKLPSLNYGYVKGIGSSNLLFDNSTPEGRFYCRTVKIEVKTPINEE